MKNTLVPLTIVFFDRAGKRVRKLSMTPCRKDPCAIYDPGRRYRFALELRRVRHPPRREARPAVGARPPRLARRTERASGCACSPSLVAVSLLAVPAAIGRQRPVVVLDPGHDLRANSATEPIGPGSSTRKIKDGGGTHGVVSGLREAELNLRVALRLRALLEQRRREGRHDANEDGRHEHRQRRACADREPCGRGALPPHPRRRLDRPGGARDAHALPGAPEGVDGRRLRGEQAGGRHRPGRAPLGARLPRSRFAGALRLHRLQLGRRPGDPRRDGLHDEPDRGPPPRDRRVPAPCGGRPLPRDVALPRALPRGLRR